MPLVVEFFGDDVDHATCRAVAVAGGRRTTDHFDALDHLRRYPAGIAPGITLAAPAQTDGVTAGNRFTVDQDQGVFRAHAADINLTVIPALAAGGVTGEVHARHGADDFRHVARGRVFTDLIGGDGRHARRLQILLGGGDHHRVFVLRGGGVVVCHGGQRDTINP